jgi:bifunctional non-homologous end joining protein LigD
VPVRPEHDWSEVKPFCRGIAEYMATTNPQRYIARSTKAARTGRIFVDYLRNDRGATAVAPYSTRARAGAPVAMPITWQELARISGPAHFTLENTLPRLKRLRKDPWAALIKIRQSIPFDRIREL